MIIIIISILAYYLMGRTTFNSKYSLQKYRIQEERRILTGHAEESRHCAANLRFISGRVHFLDYQIAKGILIMKFTHVCSSDAVVCKRFCHLR
jgi:hypothetical protein